MVVKADEWMGYATITTYTGAGTTDNYYIAPKIIKYSSEKMIRNGYDKPYEILIVLDRDDSLIFLDSNGDDGTLSLSNLTELDLENDKLVGKVEKILRFIDDTMIDYNLCTSLECLLYKIGVILYNINEKRKTNAKDEVEPVS